MKPIPSSAGIELASDRIGAGNPGTAAADQLYCVFGERHLRHILLSTRPHLSLNKDAPVPRDRGFEWAGNIVGRLILGGLHPSIWPDVIYGTRSIRATLVATSRVSRLMGEGTSSLPDLVDRWTARAFSNSVSSLPCTNPRLRRSRQLLREADAVRLTNWSPGTVPAAFSPHSKTVCSPSRHG